MLLPNLTLHIRCFTHNQNPAINNNSYNPVCAPLEKSHSMELLNSARGKDLHDSFRARIKDLKAFHLVATFSSQGSRICLDKQICQGIRSLSD